MACGGAALIAHAWVGRIDRTSILRNTQNFFLHLMHTTTQTWVLLPVPPRTRPRPFLAGLRKRTREPAVSMFPLKAHGAPPFLPARPGPDAAAAHMALLLPTQLPPCGRRGRAALGGRQWHRILGCCVLRLVTSSLSCCGQRHGSSFQVDAEAVYGHDGGGDARPWRRFRGRSRCHRSAW